MDMSKSFNVLETMWTRFLLDEIDLISLIIYFADMSRLTCGRGETSVWPDVLTLGARAVDGAEGWG